MGNPLGMFSNLKKPCKMCGTPMADHTKEFCSDKCKEVHAAIKAKKLREQGQQQKA